MKIVGKKWHPFNKETLVVAANIRLQLSHLSPVLLHAMGARGKAEDAVVFLGIDSLVR